MKRNQKHAVRIPPTVPWILRLPPTPGIIVGVLFGGSATFAAWQQYGLTALHGLWITIGIMGVYYFFRDYFRLRGEVRLLESEGAQADIVHYESGNTPRDADFAFRPDKPTREQITTEECTVTITGAVIKVVRPEFKGRYLATVQHFTDGAAIPVRNVVDRRIRVSFQYETSGQPFRVSVRLRSRKHSWEKRPDGEYCVEPLTLRETEWADSPILLLHPARPHREFLVGFELDRGTAEPGPESYLLLRNVRIWEDV